MGDSCKSFKNTGEIWPCCSYDREGGAFRLCEVHGFGFLTVDQIAVKAKHFRADDPLRIKAAILHIMSEAEGEGHLYLKREDIIERVEKL